MTVFLVDATGATRPVTAACGRIPDELKAAGGDRVSL
jgi:hypothetical protein